MPCTSPQKDQPPSKFCLPSFAAGLLTAFFLLASLSSKGQVVIPESPHALKALSIEELMELEVTSVSRSPQKLATAASAVQVITGEDIRNSAATNIAEALRLVGNLQVAQMRSNTWIIGSRGFNTLFANKLLVMIDGRTVYTPLFAGVFWDMQNVLLEDVERIEVVSGPGSTLWGANAVNGVINVITKSSKETTGLYAALAIGSFLDNQASVRYGGKLGSNTNFRVYGQHSARGATQTPAGDDFTDAWRVSQGGFRVDGAAGKSDIYTVQGDYYTGSIQTAGGNSDFNGQNVIGRWTKSFSETTDFSVQVYYDRYYKTDAPGRSSDKMNTADIDMQLHFPVGKAHHLTTGIGYRWVKDEFESENSRLAILPRVKNLDLFNSFIQDQVTLSKAVKLTVGTKLLHNVYTGFGLQPSARLAVSVSDNNTIWAAVSRAIRTPSRIDVDYFSPAIPVTPPAQGVLGGPDFVSEKMVAYELGYRVQPNHKSAFSVAAFYNRYNDLYSLEAIPGTSTFQQQNGSRGQSWGAEFSGTYQLSKNWRMRIGYTYVDVDLSAKEGHKFNPDYLANDARHQAQLHSMIKLPLNLHLDLIARYLDSIPQTLATAQVPAYFTYDARLAYRFKFAELSLTGQNLFRERHTEFGSLRIPRGYYLKLTARL
ncbi:TonB-dependent receptor [Segetibacter sp. 3557_3]|uniref:TonB-dependent receptor plug domain-containing protein n=1 Tax=Segetibacter sp. 3557_3 TaxID=2547429 RepID=UPI001058B591|nr:TonB-dependent receptor plug domain-containing protein [Segetibacter sp. 3557_3]TDH21671.1 TonB-dependent receptor [Segetibacter sp. 3557_3]